METQSNQTNQANVEAIYEEAHWHVNTGEQVIHAKRMPGRFRNIKWWSSTVWLVFFLGPYLRWDDRQAVLLDIPNRKFHIFDITIMPQDVWLLAMVLLFFAILLAAVTSIAGRVFCGYFCFQTIWTDIFTLIEEKLEGNPAKRRKLESAPWDLYKIRVRTIKHSLWIMIGVLTGISFTAWFIDAYQLWINLFTLNISTMVWVVLSMFTLGTYILAGFMREQTCFWLCPYARIQGVMYDTETILPTYDVARGEPRGKLKKGQLDQGMGDCIACNQCLAVCPTGIDIREGQQEGCITCALCLDACDAVMDKIGRPRGLIRYASMDEIEGKPQLPLHKRPRVLVYFSIMSLAIIGLLYGLFNLGSLELKVIHERQPLFVQQSDGSIKNKYDLKILNKTDQAMKIQVTVDGPKGMILQELDHVLDIPAGKLTSHIMFISIPRASLQQDRTPVTIKLQAQNNKKVNTEYVSMFYGPRF
ncbi:MAG: cytochrome c oxidase accessory protein CcoG [Gammaproteobacteria bacterium]|nr:cytochrome c oxidase accessory protein CcoG [Gammaproteobacteria bacterium]